MIRKTLALLFRALRVDARSFRPHLMRFALVAIVLYLLIVSNAFSAIVSAPGLTLFQSIAATNVWFIALVGVPYFASAIAEEKEERTLGLLKMADISGISLLLGKWLPRVLGMLSLLAVQFPFTLLSITLGGVKTDQVIASYLALFVYLLYIGAVSLLASVVCPTTAAACRVAYIAIIARALLPSLVLFLDQNAGPAGTWLSTITPARAGEFLSQATVTSHIDRALSPAFAETVWPFSLSWMVIETAAIFATAGLLFEPCTRVEASDVRRPVWQWAAKKRGTRRRAWQAALIGKDFYLLGGGPVWTTARFLIYLCGMVALSWVGSIGGGRIDARAVGYVAISMGLGFLALELIIAAARVFRTEINDQTWSSLMMLPYSLPHIAWSKVGGNVLGCWPGAALFGIGLLFAPEVLPEFLREVLTEAASMLIFIYVILQLILVLECTTLCSVTLGWAAWPLAAPIAAFIVGFANLVVGTSLLAMLVGSGGGAAEFIFAILDLTCTVVAVGLAVTISKRLSIKAADST